MTLEPECDNPNDICTKLAQHVQVAHKMAALFLIGQLLMPHRTQNRIFCVESSSSEETPNTPKVGVVHVAEPDCRRHPSLHATVAGLQPGRESRPPLPGDGSATATYPVVDNH